MEKQVTVIGYNNICQNVSSHSAQKGAWHHKRLLSNRRPLAETQRRRGRRGAV